MCQLKFVEKKQKYYVFRVPREATAITRSREIRRDEDVLYLTFFVATRSNYLQTEQYPWNKVAVDDVGIYYCTISHLKQTDNKVIDIVYSLEKNHSVTLAMHIRQML